MNCGCNDSNTLLGILRLFTESSVIFTKDVSWYGLLGESSLSVTDFVALFDGQMRPILKGFLKYF